MWPSLPGLSHLPRALLIIALALIVVIAPLLSALAARRAAQGGARAKHARYARTMLILWSLTGLAVYALHLHGQAPADVGLVLPRDPVTPYIAGLVFVFALALVGSTRKTIDPEYAEKIRRVIPVSRSDWLWFVPLAISAGICEEFLYRGYALNVLATLTGSLTVGAVLSTAAFGLAHAYQGRRGVLGTTIFGAFFALVYIYWGSLLPCMFGHVLQDLVGGVMVSRRLAAAEARSTVEEAAQSQSPVEEAAPP